MSDSQWYPWNKSEDNVIFLHFNLFKFLYCPNAKVTCAIEKPQTKQFSNMDIYYLIHTWLDKGFQDTNEIGHTTYVTLPLISKGIEFLPQTQVF